tara:strand:- start:376 stop:759 length:384 start_codon:yes stop_codon:yes gene_type:complete
MNGKMSNLIIGVDIIEIWRIGATLQRFGKRFLERIYTLDEITYCRNRAPQLSARFAAKEAVMKALGTGTRGIGWKEIEVQRSKSGQPHIKLTGRAAARASKLGVVSIEVSLSHSREYAVASVVGQLR